MTAPPGPSASPEPPGPHDLDAVVDALYTQPLDGFVAARDAAARQAAGAGDKLGAERIKRLPKPSVAAWVINHVVRERPDDVAALTAVGDELRAATQDRDRARIKALDHLRRERTESLVGAVRDAGEVEGRPVSAAVLDRLTETLTAAVMDADAGAAVRAGRLARGLQHAGFGVVDEEGEEADLVALRPEAREPEPEPEPEPEEPSTADDVERAVEETSAQVDALEALRDEVADRLRAADSAVGQAQDEVTRLDEELARLTAERDAASATLDEARTAADESRADLTAVEQELDEAEDEAAQARRRRRAARGK